MSIALFGISLAFYLLGAYWLTCLLLLVSETKPKERRNRGKSRRS